MYFSSMWGSLRLAPIISYLQSLFVFAAIKCGDLDHIQYGGVKITTYTVGSKAHFHCDKGYKLYGEPWRVCEHDGQWGGKYPVCKRKRILSEKCALQ